MPLLDGTFLNPIFKREALTHLRSPRMRWVLGIYLVAPFLAVAWKWPTGQPFYGGGEEAVEVFMAFFICQLALAFIIPPVLGAFAITSEKENRTYEFLFTTLMPSWTIGLSKLAAILLVGLSLMICSMPALSLVFYLGGVDSTILAEGAWTIILIAFFAASVGLFFSAIFTRGYAALLMTYAVVVSVCFILEFSSLDESTSMFLVFLGSVVALVLVILLTRRPPEQNFRWRSGVIDSPKLLEQRRRKWPWYLIDPAKRPEPIADGANPLILKEQLTNPMFRSAWRWRSIYLLIVAWLVTATVTLWHKTFNETGNLVSLITMILVGGWTVLIHALAFAGEHEGQTIEMLKLTRLKPGEYFRGKWIACWRLRWPGTLLAACMMASLVGFTPNFSGEGDVSRAVKAVSSFLILIEVMAIIATRAALATKKIPQTLIWTFVTFTGLLLISYLSLTLILRVFWPHQVTLIQWRSYWTGESYFYDYYWFVIGGSQSSVWILFFLFILGWNLIFIWGMARHVTRLWRSDA